MTLAEMMVALAVSALVLTVVAKLTLFTARSFVALGNYNDLDKSSIFAVDSMTRDIRQALSVSFFSTNRLDILNADGSTFSYQWSQNFGTLTRLRIVGATKVKKQLLAQCDYLNFAVYQRNPTNNFDFVATTNLNQIKLVDVNWRCSRPVLQQKVNTETVQTARIVLRN
jgi:Tfp pilus assembly protein PilW